MPLQETSGNVTTDAYGGGVAAVPVFIEDTFSTWLYTGNTTAQTITNGIDLAGKGGLVWIKSRTSTAGHSLWDTSRTPYYYLVSNATSAQQSVSSSNALTAYNADGFTVTGGSNAWNGSQNYVSWTLRKQPKFFDVVTYSGDATTSGRAIPHNLGSTPGFVIIKNLTTASDWTVWHRSLTSGNFIVLNTNDAQTSAGAVTRFGNGTTTVNPTSTDVTVGGSYYVNASGYDYAMYVFAHDAGGFGLTGSDNVISCGSYTGNGSANGPSINLGYEPQWVMIKQSSGSNNWEVYDNMRGVATGGNDALLNPNLTAVEQTSDDILSFTATGFQLTNIYSNTNGSGQSYIYIAIRRGPMKVPTVGTSVFQPIAYTGNGTGQSITTGITGDLTYIKYRTDGGAGNFFFDRLRNPKAYLDSSSTAAEVTGTQHITAFNQLGFSVGNNGNVNDSGGTFISQTFKRAPSFFDEVCYTGTGVGNRALTHNLGVAPELIICKSRSVGGGAYLWYVQCANYGSYFGKGIYLNLSAVYPGDSSGFSTTTIPTATEIYLSANSGTNESPILYVAYLFATCAGVSKVGSYTGNGTTQTINCGFGAGGARFVLIKRTDATGDWYTYDTARGMTTLTDPYLLLNSTAAETATLGSVTTVSTGFALNSTILAAINVSGGTYIFLAIA
jgi:hypothetical protein